MTFAKRSPLAILVIALALSFSASAAFALKFEIKSDDDAHSLRVGGRVHTDMEFNFTDTAAFPMDNGVQIRRARIYIQGKILELVTMKLQVDFGTGAGIASLRDAYLGFRFTNDDSSPWLQVGQFKEQFSIETLSSSNHSLFKERSFTSVFAPSYSAGVMLVVPDLVQDTFGLAIGIFRRAENGGASAQVGDAGEWGYTLRVWASLLTEEGGENALHIGGAFRFGVPNDDAIAFGSQGNQRLAGANSFIAGVAFAADHELRANLEVALILGALMLQTEYTMASVDIKSVNGSWAGHAFMFAVSYVLTGQRHGYNQNTGSIGGVDPGDHSFNPDADEWGAAEIALRFEYLDLTDNTIVGGTVWGGVLGFNWILTSYARAMFNFSLYNIANANINVFFVSFAFQWFI